MKKIHPGLLSLLSGLLFFASWPVSPLNFFIFLVFIPILWMEDQGMQPRKFFLWVYLTMFTWNISTTWWIINSTVPGAIAAFLANSLLMCIPLLGFYFLKRRMGATVGYLSLIVFWLSFEYIHLNWELSWPWLTLGNAFAMHPDWVQWYEYTGTSGGSLWVVVINVLLFQLVRNWVLNRMIKVRLLSTAVGLLLIPLAISFYGFKIIFVPRSAENIVVVQPNVDPYKKFQAGEEQWQLQNLVQLSETKIDSNTTLVVWPETAIPVAIDEEHILNHPFLKPVRDFLAKHPKLELMTGIEGFRFFDALHKTKYSVRYDKTDQYYESYNSAALFDSRRVQLYHKSKLVPGVETLPSFLHFLDAWFEKFGGTTGGYARQEERTVLIADSSRYKIAPAICYESIYGAFMAGFIRNGANIICVITNDGWWGNTPGYKQHRAYARLRAIETRCWIVRSANTGISCFIDPQGTIHQELQWDVAASIRQAVHPNQLPSTFFVRNGDVLSPFALGLSIVLILLNFVLLIIKSRSNAKRTALPK